MVHHCYLVIILNIKTKNNMISVSSSFVAFDNVTLDSLNNESKRIINDANQQLNVEDCLLTKEEVRTYTAGKDFAISTAMKHGFKEGDKIKVYCPLDEIKKSLPYHRMIPLLYDHKMIDSYQLNDVLARTEEVYSIFENPDKDYQDNRLKELDIEVIGTMGSSPYVKGDALFNCLAIWTEKGKQAVNGGKRKLSVGYLTDYVREDGEFNGETYHFRQTNIRCNHVTICYTGRCDEAIVADSLSNFSLTTKEEDAVSKATAEQKQAFASAIAQDSNGNTMPEIVKTIAEVTNPVHDTKEEDCKTMDEDKKDEDKKAEDTVEQPEKDVEKKVETHDAEEKKEEPKKDKAEDEADKDKGKAEDSITISKSELNSMMQEQSRKMYQQMAMDAIYENKIKSKIADMMGYAMDSLPSNTSVAMDAAVDALGLKEFVNKKSFDQKRVALDVAYHLMSQNNVYMDNKAMDSIAEDAVNDNDDYVKGA